MRTHSEDLDGSQLHVAIAVARFNTLITERLLNGAIEGLAALGVDEAPTLVAKLVLLADPEPHAVDLRERVAVLGGPGRQIAGRHPKRLQLRRDRAPLLVALA